MLRPEMEEKGQGQKSKQYQSMSQEIGLIDGSVHSFVKRSGRITEGQRRAIESLGPKYIIPYSDKFLVTETLFPQIKPIILEIGFGSGQATWRIAKERPEFNYLGIEVYAPGVGRLIMDLELHVIENVRILQQDAITVLKHMIAPASLAGIHVFYPDPWPKKRHHKRRLMQYPIVCLMAQKLIQGGYLYCVTDIEEYACFAKDSLDACSLLENVYGSFAPHQQWRPETRFENLAKEAGSEPFELFYKKN